MPRSWADWQFRASLAAGKEMSALPPDTHFGALQQKATAADRRHRMRLRHPSNVPARLGEQAGVLYNRQQA
jgi:hypothetical protein